MFLIPYGSDAILYHLPIVTVAMILVNTLVFLVTNGAASRPSIFDCPVLASD